MMNMASPSKYPPELCDRATRLMIEVRKDLETRSGGVRRIAEQTGVHPEALRNRAKIIEAGQDKMPGVRMVSDIDWIRQLEKENRELWRAHEILKTASA